MAKKQQQRRLGRLSKRFWEELLKEYYEVYSNPSYSCLCFGMCYVVHQMVESGTITDNLEVKFYNFIKEEFKSQHLYYTSGGRETKTLTFLWLAHLKQPRIDYIQSKIDSK